MTAPRLGRRTERVAPAVVAAVALALVGVGALWWRPVAPATPDVATDLDAFAPAVLDAVEAYRGPRYVVLAVATALDVLVPLLVVLTRRGRRWVGRMAGPTTHAPVRAGLIAAAVSVLTSLATLPLAVWAGVVQDGRWGFRTQSGWGWARDWLLVHGGTWLATAVLVVVLMAAVRRWPRSWPYRLTLLGTAVAAVLVLVHPLVLQPLLLPSSPMPDSGTREAVEAVLERQGAGDLAVHVGEASLRTTRMNAQIVGIGPTERVVLYDTLLELPTEQVEAVLAHELAHREHRDLLRGLLAVPTFLLPALLVLKRVLASPRVRRRADARGVGDPRLAAVVVALAAVLELVGSPAVNLASRRAEAAADHRGIEVTGDAAHRIATARAFTVRDLAPPDRPWWVQQLHGSHPSVRERIRAAVAQARAEGLALPSREELEERERAIEHDAVRERRR